MELYLLRHAHAGDPAKWTSDDSDRPLSSRGRRQAERLGRLLAEAGVEPDAIVASPKARATQTAEIVAEAIGGRARTDERLGFGFGLAELAGLVRDLGRPGRLLIVGHDPDFSELLADLLGAPSVPLRKGALARVDLDRDPAPGAGLLRWLVPPDLLGRE